MDARRARFSVALLLSSLTLLALALRTGRIGDESIWYDEAVSLEVTKASFAQLVSGAARDNGNPWGYWVLLKTWQQPFGRSLEAARLLSAIAGVLIIPATFFLARADGLNTRWALLGAGLTAVSPPLVFLGREARVYAIFGAVAALTILAAARARDRRRGAYLALGLGGIALLYLHYYAFFLLPALAVTILWGRWRPASHVAKIAACFVAMALAFLPLLPLLLLQLAAGTTRSETTWLLHAGLFPYFSVAGHTLVWKQHGTWLVALASTLVLLCIWLPAMWGLARSRRIPFVSLTTTACTFMLVFLASLRSPMLSSRYLGVLIPASTLLLVAGLAASFERSPRLARLAATTLTLVVTASLVRLYIHDHKPDWRGVAEVVTDHGAGKPVFFFDDTGRLPFAYYRPDDDLRPITVPFEGSRWAEEGVLASMDAQREGFWIAVLIPFAPRETTETLTRFLADRFRLLHIEDRGGVRIMLLRPGARVRRHGG